MALWEVWGGSSTIPMAMFCLALCFLYLVKFEPTWRRLKVWILSKLVSLPISFVLEQLLEEESERADLTLLLISLSFVKSLLRYFVEETEEPLELFELSDMARLLEAALGFLPAKGLVVENDPRLTEPFLALPLLLTLLTLTD
jgi:hypothetical protein